MQTETRKLDLCTVMIRNRHMLPGQFEEHEVWHQRRMRGKGLHLAPKNAARCDSLCSALRWLMQHAEMTDAPHCVLLQFAMLLN